MSIGQPFPAPAQSGSQAIGKSAIIRETKAFIDQSSPDIVIGRNNEGVIGLSVSNVDGAEGELPEIQPQAPRQGDREPVKSLTKLDDGIKAGPEPRLYVDSSSNVHKVIGNLMPPNLTAFQLSHFGRNEWFLKGGVWTIYSTDGAIETVSFDIPDVKLKGRLGWIVLAMELSVPFFNSAVTDPSIIVSRLKVEFIELGGLASGGLTHNLSLSRDTSGGTSSGSLAYLPLYFVAAPGQKTAGPLIIGRATLGSSPAVLSSINNFNL